MQKSPTFVVDPPFFDGPDVSSPPTSASPDEEKILYDFNLQPPGVDHSEEESRDVILDDRSRDLAKQRVHRWRTKSLDVGPSRKISDASGADLSPTEIENDFLLKSPSEVEENKEFFSLGESMLGPRRKIRSPRLTDSDPTAKMGPSVWRRVSVATAAAVVGQTRNKNRMSLRDLQQQYENVNGKRRSTIVSSNRMSLLHGIENLVDNSRYSLDHWSSNFDASGGGHPERINLSSLRHGNNNGGGNSQLSREIVESMNTRRKSRFRHRRHALAKILTPRERFQRAARVMRLLIRCLRTYRRISVVSHVSQMSFAMLSSDMVTTKKYRYGLTFDPADYKANSEKQLNSRTRMILTILPEHRSEEELEYALKRLRASVEEFAEFPLRMQQELTKVGWLDEFEPKRIIIRQGHQAENFYFILAGTALVTKNRLKVTGEAYAETVSILGKGKTFGELAILRHEQRTHNVISQTHVMLLTVCRRDFLKIFMHRMDESESELISFMRKLPEFKGYPLYKLPKNKPSIFAFTYFRVGVVICCDSRKSDFIVIIRSGFCRVVKSMAAAKPTILGLIEAPNANRLDKFSPQTTQQGGLVLTSDTSPLSLVPGPKMTSVMRHFLSLKQQPDKYCTSFSSVSSSTASKSTTNCSLTNLFEEDKNAEKWFRNRKKRILREYRGTNKRGTISYDALTCILNNLTNEDKEDGKSNSSISSKTPRDDSAFDMKEVFSSESDSNQHNLKKMIMQRQQKDVSVSWTSNITSETDKSTSHSNEDSSLRSESKNIENSTSNKNVFIHVETLGKNDVFGLSSILFEETEGGSSVSLISEGTECILLSKEYFLKYVDSEMRERLIRLVRPYPSDDVLKQNMQDQVNWDAYKFLTVHDQVLKQKNKTTFNDPGNLHHPANSQRNPLRNSLSQSQTPGYRYVMQA